MAYLSDLVELLFGYHKAVIHTQKMVGYNPEIRLAYPHILTEEACVISLHSTLYFYHTIPCALVICGPTALFFHLPYVEVREFMPCSLLYPQFLP
jgi:hypothetical protein